MINTCLIDFLDVGKTIAHSIIPLNDFKLQLTLNVNLWTISIIRIEMFNMTFCMSYIM